MSVEIFAVWLCFDRDRYLILVSMLCHLKLILITPLNFLCLLNLWSRFYVYPLIVAKDFSLEMFHPVSKLHFIDSLETDRSFLVVLLADNRLFEVVYHILQVKRKLRKYQIVSSLC